MEGRPNTGENKGEIIKGQQPTEDDLDWINLGRERKRSSLTTLSDVGKLLFALASTLITVYLAIAAALQITDHMPTLSREVQLVPILVWIIAGALAFWSLFPRKYTVFPNSPSQICDQHEDILKTKLWKLRLSAVIFGLGLICAGFVILNG